MLAQYLILKCTMSIEMHVNACCAIIEMENKTDERI